MSNTNDQQQDKNPGQQRTFNPREHLIQLKSREGSKDYLPIQWRLVWFREACPTGTIETEIVHLDLDKETEEEIYTWNSEKRRSEKSTKSARGVAVVRAVVRDGKGGVATGTKMEKAASFGDYLEKAETGAIGRALAELGYGTQFAPELNEAHRIVDAPVDRAPGGAATNGHANTNHNAAAASNPQPPADENEPASSTQQQRASIRKLCQHLSKSEPDNLDDASFAQAKKYLKQFTEEYKESRQQTR